MLWGGGGLGAPTSWPLFSSKTRPRVSLSATSGRPGPVTRGASPVSVLLSLSPEPHMSESCSTCKQV